MEEETVQCPYNFAHIILKHRMAAHLIKCRQQYPFDKFSTCPYNATHDVPTPEFEYHVKNCEDRRKINSFLFVTDDLKPKVDSYHIELPTTSENWDEESNDTQSYLEMKSELLENQQLFRLPVGMPKAERKRFFSKEVQRFRSISSNDFVFDESSYYEENETKTD